MKHILTTVVFLIALSTRATTNEHITFWLDTNGVAAAYDEATLKKWNMGGERAAVPESADHRNLEHMRLLVAANPDRYEAYVMYGLHFFLKQQFDVAVASYEKANNIVAKQRINDTVEYRKYYNLSLIMLYQKQRVDDKAIALETFDNLVSADLEFFARETKLAEVLALAVLDYYSVGQRDKAKRIVERCRELKGIPDRVRTKLESIYEKIDVEQVSRVKVLDPSFKVILNTADSRIIQSMNQIWTNRTEIPRLPRRNYTHKVDLTTSDGRGHRWLYDPEGYATILDPWPQPVYKFRKADQLKMILVPQQPNGEMK